MTNSQDPTMDRVRRAEMVARFRAIKHSSINISATASDEYCENRDDAENANPAKENVQQARESYTQSTTQKSTQLSPPEDPPSGVSGQQTKSESLHSVLRTGSNYDGSTTNTSSSSSAIPSRALAKGRAAAIADAKKRLAAARMASAASSKSIGKDAAPPNSMPEPNKPECTTIDDDGKIPQSSSCDSHSTRSIQEPTPKSSNPTRSERMARLRSKSPARMPVRSTSPQPSGSINGSKEKIILDTRNDSSFLKKSLSKDTNPSEANHEMERFTNKPKEILSEKANPDTNLSQETQTNSESTSGIDTAFVGSNTSTRTDQGTVKARKGKETAVASSLCEISKSVNYSASEIDSSDAPLTLVNSSNQAENKAFAHSRLKSPSRLETMKTQRENYKRIIALSEKSAKKDSSPERYQPTPDTSEIAQKITAQNSQSLFDQSGSFLSASETMSSMGHKTLGPPSRSDCDNSTQASRSQVLSSRNPPLAAHVVVSHAGESSEFSASEESQSKPMHKIFLSPSDEDRKAAFHKIIESKSSQNSSALQEPCTMFSDRKSDDGLETEFIKESNDGSTKNFSETDVHILSKNEKNDSPSFAERNTIEWPNDAFSPTSWGSHPCFSDENKFDPFDPGRTVDKEWNLNAKALALEWGGECDATEEDACLNTKTSGEINLRMNSSFSIRNLNQEKDETQGEEKGEPGNSKTDVWGNHGTKDRKPDKVCEALGGIDGMRNNSFFNEDSVLDGAEGSTHYEGFAPVSDAELLSCNDEEHLYRIEAHLSDETSATATEFDPISMFEECASVSPDIGNDIYPDDDVQNDSVSWASPRMLKGAVSKNTLLSGGASLISGNKIKVPEKGQSASLKEAPVFSDEKGSNDILDSPSGMASLESWWQSRYASTQNNDINVAVQEALNRRTGALPKQMAHEKVDKSESPSHWSQSERFQLKMDTSSKPISKTNDKSHHVPAPPSPVSDDDSSVFSGLDADSIYSLKAPPSSSSKKREMHRDIHSKYNRKSDPVSRRGGYGHTIDDSETEEDIFSGVHTTNSRQFPRIKESNVISMKSLMDSESTVESRPVQQQQVKLDNGTKGNTAFQKSTSLFLPEGGYGVIDVQNMDGHSPTGASVTSDITTSVIFGGDFSKKSSYRKVAMADKAPVKILELNDEEDVAFEGEPPMNPVETMSQNLPPLSSVPADKNKIDAHYGENIDPQTNKRIDTHVSTKEFSKNASRGRSLLSNSTTESATQPSQPSLLKKAYFMAKNGSLSGDENPKNLNCADGISVSEHVNRAKEKLFSQFSCGVLAASSFAFCAPIDENADSSAGNCESAIPNNSIVATTLKDNEEEHKTFDNGSGTIQTKKSSETLDTAGKTISGTLTETISGTMQTTSGSGSELHVETLQTDAETAEQTSPGILDQTDGVTEVQTQSDDEETDFDDDDKSTSSEDDTYDGTLDQTASSNGQTASTYSTNVNTALVYDEQTVATRSYEDGTVHTEDLSSSKREKKTLDDQDIKHRKNSLADRGSDDHRKASQTRAYETLLLYAYTALSVPPPSEIIEKGEGNIDGPARYPVVISPCTLENRSEAMNKLFSRLQDEGGMEVLKLNREKKWQQRFLVVTKESMWFSRIEDSCPKGLLWMKKLNHQSKDRSISTIGKNGKGGLLITEIQSVSVTKDNYSLSKKQKKGKFKDSFTFVLHSDANGAKRDILFRCMTKDDICTLSAGLQAVIDQMRTDFISETKPLQVQTETPKTRVMIEASEKSPIVSTKPFSPRAIASPTSDDRWEV